MTNFMRGEMNFTNDMIVDSDIISEEEGVSSNSITPSPINEQNLSYPPQVSSGFLVSSTPQHPHSVLGSYFFSPYYSNRSMYDSPYSNDHFVSSSSTSSNDSYTSIHNLQSNAFGAPVSHAPFYSERLAHSSSQDDFASYTFHDFDYSKSALPPKNLQEAGSTKSAGAHMKESSISSGQSNEGCTGNDKSTCITPQEATFLAKKNAYSKRNTRNKDKKKCSNCHATQSPSWRRSISPRTMNELLCNACGLYEKTARRKRMLVTQDDGATKVVRKRDVRGFSCSKCGVKDATRWKRTNGTIQCDKCVRRTKSLISCKL